MNWRRVDDYAMLSDPPGFAINRANTGPTIVYMAVRLGKPWAQRPGETIVRGWEGSTILHVERELDPADEDARRAALERCKAACV